MFVVELDGETVETVMIEDLNDFRRYIKENYTEYGLKPKWKRV